MEGSMVFSNRIRMSTALWTGLFVAIFILSTVFSVVYLIGVFSEEEELMLIGAIPVFLVSIGAAIAGAIFWYRAWSSIQDGRVRATPGQAVGFSFIPFFNLYWIFQLIWGFAQDFNRYVRERELPVDPLPEAMFLAIPILALVSIIPFVGMLTSLASGVLFIISVYRVCEGVNAVAVGMDVREREE